MFPTAEAAARIQIYIITHQVSTQITCTLFLHAGLLESKRREIVKEGEGSEAHLLLRGVLA